MIIFTYFAYIFGINLTYCLYDTGLLPVAKFEQVSGRQTVIS